jgi:DNA-binding PadR family transcriptional regulator
MDQAGVHQNLSLELRRGVLVLAVLSALRREQYGYSLKSDLAGIGIEIDEGTLYPLLRRLETQHLLDSRWVVGDTRPRRYYKLNPAGLKLLKALTAEWREMSEGLDRLLR